MQSAYLFPTVNLRNQSDLDQLLGDVVMGKIENMASEYEGKMKLGEDRFGQRLDWIEILHDTVAGEGLEDSDKEESEYEAK